MIFFFAQAPIVMVLCWKVKVINMKKGYETKKNFEAIVTALQITLIYNLIIYKLVTNFQ